MAQAKKKTATKTAKKSTSRAASSRKKTCNKKGFHYEKYQKGQKSNVFFIITMSALAATLLFANLLMFNA